MIWVGRVGNCPPKFWQISWQLTLSHPAWTQLIIVTDNCSKSSQLKLELNSSMWQIITAHMYVWRNEKCISTFWKKHPFSRNCQCQAFVYRNQSEYMFRNYIYNLREVTVGYVKQRLSWIIFRLAVKVLPNLFSSSRCQMSKNKF